MSKKDQKRQQSRKNLKLLKERLRREEEKRASRREAKPEPKTCLAFIYKLFGKTN